MSRSHPDLEILEPFRFRLAVLEIEEVGLPSFRVELEVRFDHSNGWFGAISRDTWFETEQWDKFARGLRRLRNWQSQSIELEDMSGLAIVSIKALGKEAFQLQYKLERAVFGLGSGVLELNHEIDMGCLDVLISRIQEFPRWWI